MGSTVLAIDERPEMFAYISAVWNEEHRRESLSNSSTTDLTIEV